MESETKRAGAIQYVDHENKILFLLGYGIYLESDIPPKDPLRMVNDTYRFAVMGRMKNPRIKLDNDDIIYGCECWHGPEEQIKNLVEFHENNGFEIREIRIEDELRRELDDRKKIIGTGSAEDQGNGDQIKTELQQT